MLCILLADSFSSKYRIGKRLLPIRCLERIWNSE